MTRRDLMLIPAVAPLARAAVPKVRVAVYGTGHAHAAAKVATLRALPEFDFAGVCEPDEPRPRHAAYDGTRWLSKREVLDDPGIEMVAVESRVDLNLAYARACVDAGKHVHIDKPPGEDLAGFRKLLADASRKKLGVQLGYMWRYQPAMQAVIEAARQGWLGHVYALRATIDKPIPPKERIALAAFRGGMMFELGCHMIDRAVDLFGKPGKVSGFMRHDGPFDDTLADNTLAVLEFERATADIYVAAHHPNGGQRRTFEVLGTNGSLAARPFSPAVLHTDLEEAAGPYKAGRHTIEFPRSPLPAHGEDFLQMARFIRQGTPLLYSPEHDLAVQETLLRACGYSEETHR
jgi:predicted dehydrogenase